MWAEYNDCSLLWEYVTGSKAVAECLLKEDQLNWQGLDSSCYLCFWHFCLAKKFGVRKWHILGWKLLEIMEREREREKGICFCIHFCDGKSWSFPIFRTVYEDSGPGRPLSCFMEEPAPYTDTTGAAGGGNCRFVESPSQDQRLQAQRLRTPEVRGHVQTPQNRPHGHQSPDLPEGYGKNFPEPFHLSFQKASEDILPFYHPDVVYLLGRAVSVSIWWSAFWKRSSAAASLRLSN